MSKKISEDFYLRDVLKVAPELPGKVIVRIIDGIRKEWIITEVEAYRGMEDKACHASKGRTKRTEIMFENGGHIYMYFIYGMHWMMNIVTGMKDEPQAVLIRSLKDIAGPGKVARELIVDGSFYGEKIFSSERIWLEEGMSDIRISEGPRIGIDYAGEYWKNVNWRFYISI